MADMEFGNTKSISIIAVLFILTNRIIAQESGSDDLYYVPFLTLSGDSVLTLPPVLDGSFPIALPEPLPLGVDKNITTYTTAYVGSNGVLSFGRSFSEFTPQRFPYGDIPLIAPYWTDIDLRGGVGNVRYTVYTIESGSSYIDQVNEFIHVATVEAIDINFNATTMLVSQWINVCPFGNQQCSEGNSFQSIVATDGTISYTIFTYQCGGLNWINSNDYAGIGFSIEENFFVNHELSLTPNVNDIACLNDSTSEWSNVVYCVGGCIPCVAYNPCKNGGLCILSTPANNYTCNCTGNYTGDMCEGCNYECRKGEVPSGSCNGSCVIVDICVATSPCQNGGTCIIAYDGSYRCSCPLFYTGYNCEEIYSSGSESVNDNNFYYLPFLNLSGDGVLTLPNAFGGSYPITLPEPLPLGDTKNITTYTTAYVGSNGVMSFGHSFYEYIPKRFPYGDIPLIAPYWTGIDLTGGIGNVRYTVYTTENGSSYIDQVNEFLDNTENGTFTATTILVAQWIDVCSIDDYLCFEGNTFQSIVATDGTLSYAIFTYWCGGLNWINSYDYAGIGFSIGQDFFVNHELSLTPSVNDIACLNDGWNNVVYLVSEQDICVVANPCMNGGICILNAHPNDYTCNCTGNYTGDTCEDCNYACREGETPNSSCDGSCDKTDICLHICQNGGTCIATDDGSNYRCSCPLFYTGYNCEGTSLLDVSSCSGPSSSICQGRRLSVICKAKEMSGESLPPICDDLNNIA